MARGPDKLAGTLAVLTLDSARSAAVARRLSREGATVLIVADDPEAAGRLAAEMARERGPRPAVFCVEDGDGETELDALVELAAEASASARRREPGVG